MSGETEQSVSGWTVDTLHNHLRVVQQLEERFSNERDRRYTEVNIEKEKALKIKETADLAALQLARDIQIYKDEKANELREQINSERGLYVTKNDLAGLSDKFDVTLRPVLTYIALQQGRSGGLQAGYGWIVAAIGAIGVIITIVVLIANKVV